MDVLTTPRKQKLKQLARAGAILSVGALSLGASNAEPVAQARYIAKTNTLSPAPFVRQPMAPVVQQEVRQAPATPAPEVVETPAATPVVVASAPPKVNNVATVRTVKQAGATYAVGTDGILRRIAQCESGGSYTAQNSRSTASGKYQFLNSTWGGYGGYKRAADAPPAVQDAKAQATLAKSGTRPWAASQRCWR